MGLTLQEASTVRFFTDLLLLILWYFTRASRWFQWNFHQVKKVAQPACLITRGTHVQKPEKMAPAMHLRICKYLYVQKRRSTNMQRGSEKDKKVIFFNFFYVIERQPVWSRWAYAAKWFQVNTSACVFITWPDTFVCCDSFMRMWEPIVLEDITSGKRGEFSLETSVMENSGSFEC